MRHSNQKPKRYGAILDMVDLDHFLTPYLDHAEWVEGLVDANQLIPKTKVAKVAMALKTTRAAWGDLLNAKASGLEGEIEAERERFAMEIRNLCSLLNIDCVPCEPELAA